MMRIRCPNCDSTHEVPDSVLAGKPRKVRCASCRTVFEAKADSDSPGSGGDLASEAAAVVASLATARKSAAPDWGDAEDPLIGESMEMAEETSSPSMPADDSVDMDAAMGQDDLDALFADLPPEPASDAPAATPELDMAAMEAGAVPRQTAGGPEAAMLAAATAAGAAAVAGTNPEPKPRKRNPHARSGGNGFRLMPALGVVAATGIGTLVGLTIFRHETVRIMPSLAPYFEMLGLEVNSTGLEIRGVRSYVVMEDHREMLEITGQVVNITRTRQHVPVIRLSLHNSEGQQLYVWTGNADIADLGAGEKTLFRRRLATPPKDATQVMVRFVARDDIVAAIR